MLSIEIYVRRQNKRANLFLKFFDFGDEPHSSKELASLLIDLLDGLEHPSALFVEPCPQEENDLLLEESFPRLSKCFEKNRVVWKFYFVETSLEQRCELRPDVVFA